MDRWPIRWMDGCMMLTEGSCWQGSCIVKEATDFSEVCVSRAEISKSQRPVVEADLWGDAVRIQGCIFSTQRSCRSSSDRRLLTVIGCYMGGCQLKRQFEHILCLNGLFGMSEIQSSRCVVKGSLGAWNSGPFESKIRTLGCECACVLILHLGVTTMFVWHCLYLGQWVCVSQHKVLIMHVYS